MVKVLLTALHWETIMGAYPWEKLILPPQRSMASCTFCLRVGTHEIYSVNIYTSIVIAIVLVLFMEPFLGKTDSQTF